MKPLLQFQNLSVYFKQNHKQKTIAVEDFNATLYEGEVLGIVGESGSGKSVTALSVLGLLPYPKAFHSAKSSILYRGMELIGASDENLKQIRGGKIGFVFQEPMSSLNPLHRVGEQIAENLYVHQPQLTKRQIHAKTIELLKSVGIIHANERYKAFPHELSGGQRQRVMIAMAVANNPEILIADEPTTALDVTIQAQIIDLLLKLKKERGMSIIFISHNLHLVRRIADRIIVMKQGLLIEQGTTKAIFKHPKEEYTRQLMNSLNVSKLKTPENAPVIAKINRFYVEFALQKSFWGRVKQKLLALNNVSFNLYQGQTLGIVGESGSGKTTLGLSITSLMKHKGTMTLIPPAKDEKEFRKRVQIVFQDPYNSLNPRLNVLEIVGEGLKVHFPKLSKHEVLEKVIQILKETGLKKSDLYKYPHQFSGGQRQRIAIARALVLNPEIVVLDEPTSALDVTIQAQILEMLRQLQQKRKISYVFISHDMFAIRRMAHQVAVMKDGRIIEMNTAEKIFKEPEQPYTKQLIEASLVHN